MFYSGLKRFEKKCDKKNTHLTFENLSLKPLWIEGLLNCYAHIKYSQANLKVENPRHKNMNHSKRFVSIFPPPDLSISVFKRIKMKPEQIGVGKYPVLIYFNHAQYTRTLNSDVCNCKVIY